VNQHVSEAHGIGRVVWRAIRRLHVRHPVLSTRLGSYVTYVARKGSSQATERQAPLIRLRITESAQALAIGGGCGLKQMVDELILYLVCLRHVPVD